MTEQGEAERRLPSADHSLDGWGRGWARLKQGAWNFIQVSSVVGGARTFGPPFSAFPGALAGSWLGSEAAWTGIGALVWDTGIASGESTCCTTVLAWMSTFTKFMK